MGKLFSKRRKSTHQSKALPGESDHSMFRSHHISGGGDDSITSSNQFIHSDAVVSIVTIRTGLCLSGSKDKSVILYDYIKEKIEDKWTGHNSAVTKVCYGASTGSIFSASRDKTVKMWHPGKSECQKTFQGHDLVVTAIDLNEENNRLCSGSRDNSVKLWDVETAACLRSNTISQNLVTDLKYVPSSNLLVQTGEDKEIRVFDVRSFQPVFSFPKKQQIQTSCDVSKDGNYVISSSNGFSGNGCEATLWDMRGRQMLVEYHGHQEAVESCIILPSSTCDHIATASRDGSVRVWDMMTGKCVAVCFVPSSGPLTSLAACTDSSVLVASFNQGISLLRPSTTSFDRVFSF